MAAIAMPAVPATADMGRQQCETMAIRTRRLAAPEQSDRTILAADDGDGGGAARQAAPDARVNAARRPEGTGNVQQQGMEIEFARRIGAIMALSHG
jgi:hypothetical protein